MSSNQIVSACVVSGPSGLSRVCRRWAKGTFLSALLGTAVMFGPCAALALAAPANGSGGPSVFSTADVFRQWHGWSHGVRRDGHAGQRQWWPDGLLA